MTPPKANSPAPDTGDMCEECDGYGWYYLDGDEDEQVECVYCRGDGYARKPVAVPSACRVCNGTGAPRPRSEILAARRTVGGCCDRHADNSACDCLSETCCGACNGTGRR